MGIITKDDGKNRVSLMVRMPHGMAEVIDMSVGILYTSRPDFVIEAIRRFIHYVCNEEAGIMLYLQDKKDADRDVRLEFYRESIREKTELFRNTAAEAAAKSKRDVDILLSLPKGLASEIDRTVERTGCFRNHHEFVKSATVYLMIEMAADNTNAMLTDNFLVSNQTTSELRAQIDRMKEEMSGLGRPPSERSHGDSARSPTANGRLRHR